uniref:Uncharacterized protein n=1 Tax=Anguilla anguilla TaxID=7936 RepID=A0A0E9SWC8_ANGAN
MGKLENVIEKNSWTASHFPHTRTTTHTHTFK